MGLLSERRSEPAAGNFDRPALYGPDLISLTATVVTIVANDFGRSRRHLAVAPALSAALAKADQFLLLFIPQVEAQGFQAGAQGDRLDALKELMRVVALLQIIIGNARTQVMNMVKANVAREPLQNFRQFVERTALEGRRGEVPFARAFPVGVFKLVLDIEHPDADGAAHGGNRQLDEQVGFEAKKEAERRHHGENREIHPIDGMALAFVGLGGGKTLPDQKEVKRGKNEQHERVAREAVGKALPAGGLEIFLHSHRPDIAGAAFIQVAGGGMVDRMFPAPMEIGGESQQASDKAHRVISGAVFEKRTVATVVKNDEDTHQEAACEHRQRQRNPPRHAPAPIHQSPEGKIRAEGVGKLTNRSWGGWDFKLGDNFFPRQSFGVGFFRR
jgi:hypothetical protein